MQLGGAETAEEGGRRRAEAEVDPLSALPSWHCFEPVEGAGSAARMPLWGIGILLRCAGSLDAWFRWS